ncbi:hypothetical protein H2203_001827 [Taxawa tesnikishii (nom. ined.)]|nr:hypothetical protein H2203_001827 [Dothideales sp. JES 119]
MDSSSSSSPSEIESKGHVHATTLRPEDVPQTHRDAPFLDFLYPPQALAFLSRLSTATWERWERRNSPTALSGLRGYSSMSGAQAKSVKTEEGHRDYKDFIAAAFPSLDTSEGAASNKSAGSAVKSAIHLSAPDKSLQGDTLPRVSGRVETVAERAWDAFCTLPEEAQKKPEVLERLLGVCTEHARLRPETRDRVKELAERVIDMKEAPASLYYESIGACLKADLLQTAVDVHERGVKMAKEVRPFGSNLLLIYAVAHRNWDLALSILQSFSDFQARLSLGSRTEAVWDGVERLPGLYDRVTSLIQTMEGTARRAIRDPWSICGRHARVEVRNVMRLVMVYAGARFRGANIEFCLHELLKVPDCAENDGLYSLIWRSYAQFRSLPEFKPSVGLFFAILKYWCKRLLFVEQTRQKPTLFHLEQVVSDWKQHRTYVNKDAIVHCMSTFAKLGRFEDVERYLADYLALFPQGGRNLLAREQFNRIKNEFGVEPDVQSWSVLLHAHAEAEDIDGALELLEQMDGKGIRPNEYSYSPLLEIYGKRGDVVEATKIMEAAQTHGVVPSTHMLAGLINAYVNDDDVEAAKEVLAETVDGVKKGKITGELTSCFNTVMTAHALRREPDETMRTYRQMRAENVRLDDKTYAALIQSMTLFRQTNTAWKIVREVMPESGIRTTAFHYAIIIVGYMRQKMYREAVEVAATMEKARIRPTVNSRRAALRAKALLGNETAPVNPETREGIQLRSLIDDLLEMVEKPNTSMLSADQDEKSLRRFDENDVISASYFDFAIYIHGVRRCFDAVKEILSRYFAASDQTLTNDNPPPIRILTALMSALNRAGEFAEVERLWDLAKTQADALTAMPATTEIALRQSRRLSSKGFKGARKPTHTVAPGYRFILTSAFRYYMVSLVRQDPPQIDKIHGMFIALQQEGYAFDNATWNAYIRALCRGSESSPPRTMLAFTLVERHMMASWPGWIRDRGPLALFSNPTTLSSSTPTERKATNAIYYRPTKAAVAEGTQYMKKRYFRKGELVPQYRTMVYLGARLLELRNAEAVGRRKKMKEQLAKQVGSVRAIRELAPKTMYAVQSMPMVFDNLQRKLLRKE